MLRRTTQRSLLSLTRVSVSSSSASSAILGSAFVRQRRWIHSGDPFIVLTKEHKEAQGLCDKILVTKDHKEALDLSADLIRQTCIHSAIEEIHVYPLANKLIALKEAAAESLQNRFVEEHRGIKTLLAELEDHITDTKNKPKEYWPKFPFKLVEDLKKYLTEHAHEEESELFAKLRKTMEPLDLANLHEKLEAERKWAPLHPRPNAPGTPPFAKMADRVAGVVDRLSGK